MGGLTVHIQRYLGAIGHVGSGGTFNRLHCGVLLLYDRP